MGPAKGDFKVNQSVFTYGADGLGKGPLPVGGPSKAKKSLRLTSLSFHRVSMV